MPTRKEVLAPQMDPTILKELQEMEKNDFDNQNTANCFYYTEHIQNAVEEWPESINRCFKHINP
jgi:proline iminopeptidase